MNLRTLEKFYFNSFEEFLSPSYSQRHALDTTNEVRSSSKNLLSFVVVGIDLRACEYQTNMLSLSYIALVQKEFNLDKSKNKCT